MNELTLDEKKKAIDLTITFLLENRSKFTCTCMVYALENMNIIEVDHNGSFAYFYKDVIPSVFPEFEKMVIEVASNTQSEYEYYKPWSMPGYDDSEDRRQFRLDKLNEFKLKMNEK